MDDLKFLRQQDAIDQSRLTSLSITVIGAGAIGSTTSVFLGKMGACGLQIFDADFVEPHNWSNQLYRDEDIGKLKVTALIEVMEQFGGHTPNATAQRYVDQDLSEVVVSCVDSMSSRLTIWRSVREKPECKILIDARMGFETLMVWAIKPQVKEDRIAYSQSLYSDEEALQESCTRRAIAYTPALAAAVICNLVKRYVNAEELSRQVIIDLTTWSILTS